MSDEVKLRVYLAGQMRGIPQFNFPQFHEAAAWLRKEGYHVFNPAEKDAERHGADFGKDNATGDEKKAASTGFSLRVALGDDLEWICKHADGIALLPGWEKSLGATAERATAIALGLERLYLHHDVEGWFITREPHIK